MVSPGGWPGRARRVAHSRRPPSVRLQAAHHPQPPRRAVIEGTGAADERRRRNRDRHVERAADLGAEERGRRDADDGERHAFDRDAAAEGGRRSSEAPLPEVVADHGDGPVGTQGAPIVLGGERASDDRLDPEHLEHAAACPQSGHLVALAGRGQVEALDAPGERAVEHGVIAQLLPDRIGPVAARTDAVGQRHREQHQAFGLGDRQRPEQQSVDDGEDGAVGADRQGEGHDGHDRDDRRGGQRPQTVAHILGEPLDRPPPPGLAHVFADRADVAEVAAGRIAGGAGAEPVGSLHGGFLIEMKRDLLVELGGTVPPPPPRPHAIDESPRHARSPTPR